MMIKSGDENLGEEQLLRLQERLVDNAFVVSTILLNHRVRHTLAYGSLLGAVRHQGFIPWDDDFDFYIADEDYDLATEVLEQSLPNHLIVHSLLNDPNYFLGWNKVKDLRTAVLIDNQYHDDNNLLNFKCLSVDLYRLPKMFFRDIGEYLEREAQEFWTRKFNLGLISKLKYSEGLTSIDDYVLKKMKTIGKQSPDAVVRYSYLNMIRPVPDECVFPAEEIVFGPKSFLAPRDAMRVLDSLYGDWRKLPAEGERVSSTTRVRFFE